jgi:predicted MFS family arabinose efflux permease
VLSKSIRAQVKPMQQTEASSLGVALANPDFVRVWLTGLCVGVMRWLEILAIGIYTLEATGSAFDVALMYFARTVPTLIGGPIAGMLVERANQKYIYTGGLLLMLALSLTLATLSVNGALALWHVAIGAVLAGFVWSLEHTVRRMIARDVVPPASIGKAISFDTGSQNATRMLGPLAGGILMAMLGLQGAYILGAAFYASAVLFMLGISPTRRLTTGGALPFWQGLRLGFRYAWGQPLLAGVLAVTVVLNMFGFPYAAMVPVIGRDSLGLTAEVIGLLMSSEGLGAVLGALVLAATVKRRLYAQLFAGGAFLFLAMMVVFANAPSFLTASASLLCAGIGLGLFAAMQSTILLTVAEPAMRGRVMGMLVVTIGAGPFGVLMLGALAEHTGAADALFITSSVGIALLLLVFLRWPQLLRELR